MDLLRVFGKLLALEGTSDIRVDEQCPRRPIELKRVKKSSEKYIVSKDIKHSGEPDELRKTYNAQGN